MRNFSRKDFFAAVLGGTFISASKPQAAIMTIRGKIPASKLGLSLIHEHFLVDFIGADKISYTRWNRTAVVNKVLPYILQAKASGVKTIFDCTPAYLGRDVLLLQELAEQSGMQIVTNTGFYGAVQNKYLPPFAFEENAEKLAERWIKEFEKGIEGTGVKPGFIKISVDPAAALSAIHRKLVEAAAITHLHTGMTICSHTGPAAAAFQQLAVLEKSGVGASAFVWVHAQAEKEKQHLLDAAARGSWISLDGLGWGKPDAYADTLIRLKSAGLLHQVLISHDAGWYKPEAPDAAFTGYTNIFTGLMPILKSNGFSDFDMNQLLNTNPAEAFQLRIRRK